MPYYNPTMLPQRKSRISTTIVLAVGFIAIVLYCFFVSRHRILWSDELFSWMLLTDPSYRHMIKAWQAGADGGGFAFYLLCRTWLRIFGHSFLAFREFSAFNCFVGFAFLWLALRRYYRLMAAASALFTVWFGSNVILWQMVQTRFYGLLLGASCFALYAAVRSAWQTDEKGRDGAAILTLTFAANLLLVNVHPLGIGYSAALLLGAALSDLCDSRRRAGFYVAVLLTWPTLLLSSTAMEASARVGWPWFWTVRPSLRDLLLFWIPDLSNAGRYARTADRLFLMLLLGTIVLCGIAVARRQKIRRVLRSHSALLLPALGLLLSPLAIFVLCNEEPPCLWIAI